MSGKIDRGYYPIQRPTSARRLAVELVSAANFVVFATQR